MGYFVHGINRSKTSTPLTPSYLSHTEPDPDVSVLHFPLWTEVLGVTTGDVP